MRGTDVVSQSAVWLSKDHIASDISKTWTIQKACDTDHGPGSRGRCALVV